MNVYSCLVCGKFFQGRSKDSPAYTHSVQYGHFVFINLSDLRAFCLPDSYEIIDQSLDDVKRCLNPIFSKNDILQLNDNTSLARDVHGISYLPGFVGLNNLKHTDYANAILHALSHVTPLRNFFLDPNNYSNTKSKLVLVFGKVIRKLWSRDNFKSVISPIEFLEEVSITSKKKFDIGQPADCVEFLIWLLSELHRGLGGSNKRKSIIHECFQGLVEVTTISNLKGEFQENASNTNFMYLPLDIPPTPLFRDSTGGMIIPQIPLFEILKKYDSEKITEVIDGTGNPKRHKYKLKVLPKFLILHLIRFTKNNFTVEKNVSIVTFPVKNLELKDYIIRDDDLAAHISNLENLDMKSLSIEQLKSFVIQYGYDELKHNLTTVVEKYQLIELATVAKKHELSRYMSKYDLLANICHDSQVSQEFALSNSNSEKKKSVSNQKVPKGQYRVHLKSKTNWLEIEDLHVKEIMPQSIGLSESYILIYQRKD
jgi:U4/U6.U5 tri-snRNP-associated protein 2